MEMSMYLLFCGILLLPVSQQLSNEQIINRQPDIITFNQRSAPGIVPFTFPSQSTGSSFNLPPVPLPPFPQPPPQNQQQFNQLHFAPAIPLPAAVNPDELVGTRGSTPKNHSTSQQIQQQNHHNNGFSIPTAMLSLALDMGRCKGNAENDCATNTVFSPLSIASTLTMLLMGKNRLHNLNFLDSLQNRLVFVLLFFTVQVRVVTATSNFGRRLAIIMMPTMSTSMEPINS
jgi:hypothetical protein